MAYSMRVSENAFKEMQFDSGMILNTFNLDNPATPTDEEIACTTSGDITIDVNTEMTNFAEDVNNVHGNFLEFQQITGGWTVTISFEALEASLEVVQMALGAADIIDGKKVAPRNDVKTTDFKDRYWVGKLIGGGLAVAHFMNTLSTSGLSLTTSKDEKGRISVTLTAFASLQNQDVVPVEFYVIKEESEEEPDTGSD